MIEVLCTGNTAPRLRLVDLFLSCVLISNTPGAPHTLTYCHYKLNQTGDFIVEIPVLSAVSYSVHSV